VTVDLDLDLAFGHHLLVVGADVSREEVEALALSWFPRAAALGEHAILLADDAVLTGPWTVSDGDRRALRLPAHATQVYLLRCPVQRAGPPPPELVDPAGLSGAFRSGMPFGLEAESVTFLLAAARRLGGALRVAGSGSVLAPDPDAEVNLWVYSPVWLDPDALVAVVAPVLPSFGLAMELGEPIVPPTPPASPGEPGDASDGDRPPGVADGLEAGARAWLHAEAAAFDAAALAEPPTLAAFGGVAQLGEDGMIEVTVEGEELVPLVLQGLDWAQDGVITYAVRWWPTDPAAQYAPDPGEAFRAARARVRALVERTVRAVHAAVGGEVADESGFLVDPASLA
jgi:hypothetical protein